MVVRRVLSRSLTALSLVVLPLAATAREASLQDLGDALATPSPPAVIYTAKEIVTLDPLRPSVAAAARRSDDDERDHCHRGLGAAPGNGEGRPQPNRLSAAVYPVALADNYRVHGLGPEQADAMVRMGDVERAGISFSYHSDMPMAPGQPLFLIWAGVNRLTNAGHVRGPEQRVSPIGGLRAVTLDAAFSLQLEQQVGSLVPGKLANFTILAANPLRVDPLRIKDIPVWGTVQEGRVLPVRRAPGSSGITRLGPVLDPPTLASLNQADAAEVGHDHGEACALAQELAKAAAEGLRHQLLMPSPTTRGRQNP